MKKTFKFLAMFLVAIITLCTSSTVNAAASSIKLGDSKAIDPYIAGTYFTTKTTADGHYAYCMNIHKATARNTTANLVGEKDAGFAYIINNGYPKKTFTGDAMKDYYITQTAVWWYLDETTGSNNLTNAFKTTGSDQYNLRPYIKKLVAGAKVAKQNGYANTTLKATIASTEMKLASNKKYYISDMIKVTSTNLNNYTVEVVEGPNGTIVTDKDGKEHKTYDAKDEFKIKVPTSQVKGKISVKVKISGTGTIGKAYEYAPVDSNMQHVLPAYLVSENKTVSDSIKVTAKEESKVSIIKLDKKTNQPLQGAKLVLKDSSGKTIDSWTTTNVAHVINNIPNGNYTVEEIAAPEGYKLSKEKIKVTISDTNKSVEIKFYNETLDKVVSIIKLDKKTNKPVAGAKLILKDKSGKEITRWTTTTQAHIIKNLSNGKYIVEELEAPKGYKLSKEKVEITIDNKHTSQSVKFYNEMKERVVNILKIDKETGNPLAGATLVLKDMNGKEVLRFTTTTDPYVITNIKDGTYTLEEESAPAGYIRSDEIITFTVDSNHLSHQITFENYKAVEVPDTNSNSNIILTILGITIIGLGIAFVKKNEYQA